MATVTPMVRGDRIETPDGRTGIVEGYSGRLDRCVVSFDGDDCARLVEPGEMVHALVRVRTQGGLNDRLRRPSS